MKLAPHPEAGLLRKIWFRAPGKSATVPAMKRLALVWLLLAAALPALAAADSSYFLTPASIAPEKFLPAPPVPGSLAALGDLETILQVQAARTPAEVAWARLIEKENYFSDFREVLGPWFEEKNLPVFVELIRQIIADANVANRRVKGLYARQRPPAMDSAVQPCVAIPVTNSYPSGHSLRAHVCAAVLGDIFPDRREPLWSWAHHVAWGRVIGGVHFPTDVVGGRLVAEAIMVEIRKSPAYRAAVEKCQAEAVPFLLKKAA